jgi:hypothetical protein
MRPPFRTRRSGLYRQQEPELLRGRHARHRPHRPKTFKLLQRGHASRPVLKNLPTEARAERIGEVVDENFTDVTGRTVNRPTAGDMISIETMEGQGRRQAGWGRIGLAFLFLAGPAFAALPLRRSRPVSGSRAYRQIRVGGSRHG